MNIYEAFGSNLRSLGQLKAINMNEAEAKVEADMVNEDTCYPVMIINLKNGRKRYVEQ